ncbi:MAG: MarR family transcriptional regulator, partial [Bacillota bacterium]|nr:MarR family transcriptional regulator [Bacillota bacterium]
EKKAMVERIRSEEDRRIVQIHLTEKAKDFLSREIEVIEYYFKKIYSALTDEEKTAAVSIFRKVTDILYQGRDDSKKETAAKKVKRITVE